jgi:excisionase family DNA binding protein
MLSELSRKLSLNFSAEASEATQPYNERQSHEGRFCLITAQEAAKRLSLSKGYLYRLARAGRLPCHRVGRAVRFNIDELHAWLITEPRAELQTPTPSDADRP